MSDYRSVENTDGSLKLEKSYEKLSEENTELANEYDQITKIELINAIKTLVSRINTLEGNVEGDGNYLELGFTYYNKKHDI